MFSALGSLTSVGITCGGKELWPDRGVARLHRLCSLRSTLDGVAKGLLSKHQSTCQVGCELFFELGVGSMAESAHSHARTEIAKVRPSHSNTLQFVGE